MLVSVFASLRVKVGQKVSIGVILSIFYECVSMSIICVIECEYVSTSVYECQSVYIYVIWG